MRKLELTGNPGFCLRPRPAPDHNAHTWVEESASFACPWIAGFGLIPAEMAASPSFLRAIRCRLGARLASRFASRPYAIRTQASQSDLQTLEKAPAALEAEGAALGSRTLADLAHAPYLQVSLYAGADKPAERPGRPKNSGFLDDRMLSG